MGYKARIVQGIGLLGSFRVLTRLATLGKTAVLARLLTPADFGRFGVAALSLALFETMTETGVNQVLVHSGKKVKEVVSSAWVIAIARGALIAILIALTAPLLVNYFGDAGVYSLVLLVALVPLIKGFINPMIVGMIKELHFKQEVKFRGILLMVETTAAIVVAYLTRSAMAFVVALLVSAVFEVAMSFVWFRVWPSFRFRVDHLKEIIGYGKWVTFSGIAHWVASQLDDLVAGRLFGTGVLGVYQAAYKISTLPVTEISGTINQVAFPVLAKVKDDRLRLMKIFRASVGTGGILGLLLTVVLMAFPNSVVTIILGRQWLEAVPLVRYLAVFGLVRTLESGLQPLFLATGRPQVATWGNVLKVIALIIGLSFWAANGVIGVALAVVVSGVTVVPYYVWQLRRL